MKYLVFVLLVATPVFCKDIGEESEGNSYLKDFKVLYHLYEECSSKEWSSCLKIKLITALDRVARNYNTIKLVDGIILNKETSYAPAEPVAEDTLEMNLPRSSDAKDDLLNNMVMDKVMGLISSFSLKINLADASESSLTEARGKKNRGLLLLPLLFAGTLLPIALGGLALLAGKALIVSKLALLLAGVIALKKLLSGHGGHGGGRRLHTEKFTPSHSMSDRNQDQAQKMAYSSYVPSPIAPKTS